MSILLHTPERGDGLGRRVKEHNVAGGTVTDRNFVWDGLEMVQWQNADGTVQRNLFAQGDQIMFPQVRRAMTSDAKRVFTMLPAGQTPRHCVPG